MAEPSAKAGPAGAEKEAIAHRAREPRARSLSGSRGAGKPGGWWGTALEGSEERSRRAQHAPSGGWASQQRAGLGSRTRQSVRQTPSPTLIQKIELPVATQLSYSEPAEDEDVWLIHSWASVRPQTCSGPIQQPRPGGNRAAACGHDLTVRIKQSTSRWATTRFFRWKGWKPCPLPAPLPTPSSLSFSHRHTF